VDGPGFAGFPWFYILAAVSNPDIRKAAVLLMSLPKETAGQLMGKLTHQQSELVSVEIAKIGPLSSDERDSAINDFAAASQSSIIEAKPFGFLQEVDCREVLKFIIDEHPQTVALILSHLQPEQAALIIAGLPVDRRLDIVRRIAGMRPTSREIVHEVEKGLENRMSVASRQLDNEDGAGSVAAILSFTDQGVARSLLEELGQEHPHLVEEIRRLLDNARSRSTAA
jgi:flagellar motor switch protein FliG